MCEMIKGIPQSVFLNINELWQVGKEEEKLQWKAI